MNMSMKRKAREFDELLMAAHMLKDQVKRQEAEILRLTKDLTLTKLQLEEAWKQMD